MYDRFHNGLHTFSLTHTHTSPVFPRLPPPRWPNVDDFGVVIDWEPVSSASLPFTAVCNAEPVFSAGRTIEIRDPKWDEGTRTFTASLATPEDCSVGCNLFLSFYNTSGGCVAAFLLLCVNLSLHISRDRVRRS